MIKHCIFIWAKENDHDRDSVLSLIDGKEILAALLFLSPL